LSCLFLGVFRELLALLGLGVGFASWHAFGCYRTGSLARGTVLLLILRHSVAIRVLILAAIVARRVALIGSRRLVVAIQPISLNVELVWMS